MYNLFKTVCKYHNVSLVCTTDKPTNCEAILHLQQMFRTVDIVEREPSLNGMARRTVFDKVRELWRPPWDYMHMGGYPVRNVQKVRSLIKQRIYEQSIDGIYAFGWSLGRYFEDINIPVVYDIIDDPTVLHFRSIRHQHGMVAKLRSLKEAIVTMSFERKHMGRFKEAVMVSSEDARTFVRLCPKTRVTVIPQAIDSEYFQRVRPLNQERPTFLFTGVMAYPPNVAAAVHFAKNIFPLIKKHIADARYVIAGRDPVPEVMALATDPSIEVTGTVEDIRENFNDASIYVCPLISGAGIKNKILEAWSMETPVVATSLSCEGLLVSPDLDILVADNPKDFAERCLQLFRDTTLANRLTSNGRAKVKALYDWDSQAGKVTQIFKRLLGQPQPSFFPVPAVAAKRPARVRVRTRPATTFPSKA